MTTSPRFFSRRSFALICCTVMLAVSSMYICSPLRTPAPDARRTQSSLVSMPFRSFWESTSDSVESIRLASSSLDISSENTATSLSLRRATLVAMFSAKEVFPIPGRAAIRISSDLFRPEMVVSRYLKPVLAPRYFSRSGPAILPIWSYASQTASPILVSPRTSLPCRMSKIRCSAASISACALCSPDWMSCKMPRAVSARQRM